MAVLACVLAALLTLPSAAGAVDDIPRDHWAYDAVQDLASRGLIKGYPPDGNFFGSRTVTRYEMAALVQRALAYALERAQEAASKPSRPSEAPGMAPDERALGELRKLVEEFKVELTVMGTDLAKVKEQLGELRQEIADVKVTAEQAAAAAEQAREAAEQARTEIPDIIESLTLQRTEFNQLVKNVKGHQLSGYLQARFEIFDTGQTSLFPEVGATGGPAVGGPNYGFLVRRARLKFGGPITTRGNYALQMDVPSTGATAIKDAYINIGDMPWPNTTILSVGLFAPPFGVELPQSSSVRESPERAGGFTDSSASFPMFKGVRGMFEGQDRDVGVMISLLAPNYINPKTRFYLGVFNGEGRGASGVRNTNKQVDTVVRAQTELLNGALDIGVSGYYGAISVKKTSSDTAPTVRAYRMLGGADIRYIAPWGTTFRAEYAGGLYEVTPDRSLFLDGNHAYAWLLSARHTVNRRLDLALKYDEFYPVSQKGISLGGLGRMDLVRKTLGGGLLYQIDEYTRFRLWYARGLTPYDPSAPPGPKRSRLGLVTAEFQISY